MKTYFSFLLKRGKLNENNCKILFKNTIDIESFGVIILIERSKKVKV